MIITPDVLPSWEDNGVLPPIRPGEKGHSSDRSPYSIDIVDFVQAYALSLHRVRIIEGFFEFRSRLHSEGIVDGFQWLNGSFGEHIELIETRDPRDIDVVSFVHLPSHIDQEELYERLEPENVKKSYLVDHYFVLLGYEMNYQAVQEIAYWYSMWSHQRTGLWKGFVEVDLSPANDAVALQTLHDIKATL